MGKEAGGAYLNYFQVSYLHGCHPDGYLHTSILRPITRKCLGTTLFAPTKERLLTLR